MTGSFQVAQRVRQIEQRETAPPWPLDFRQVDEINASRARPGSSRKMVQNELLERGRFHRTRWQAIRA